MHTIGYLLLNVGVYVMLITCIIAIMIHIDNTFKLFVRIMTMCAIMITIGTIAVDWS